MCGCCFEGRGRRKEGEKGHIETKETRRGNYIYIFFFWCRYPFTLSVLVVDFCDSLEENGRLDFCLFVCFCICWCVCLYIGGFICLLICSFVRFRFLFY